MQSRRLRVIGFLGVCFVFGAMVWVVEIQGDLSRQVLYAAPIVPVSPLPSADTGSTKPSSGSSEADVVPDPEKCGIKETISVDPKVAGKLVIKKEIIDENKCEQVLILLGKNKTCKKTYKCSITTKSAYDSSRALVAQVGQLSALISVTAQGKCLFVSSDCGASGGSSPTPIGGSNPAVKPSDLASLPPVYTPINSPYPSGPSGGDIVPNPPPKPPAPTPTPSPSPTPIPTPAPSPASGGSGGGPPAGGAAYTPSPSLLNAVRLGQRSPIALNINIGDSGGGSPAGYAPVGGSFAYVQPGPPAYYNRNFDSADSQVTFAQPQVSTYDLIKKLAANTPRTRAQITPETLTGQGTSDGGILKRLGDVLSPVGELFTSAFSPPGNPAPFSVEAEAEGGVFSLSAKEFNFLRDNSTLAPAIVSGGEGVSPFSDGAMVRDPFRLIDEIANGPFAFDSETENTSVEGAEFFADSQSRPSFAGGETQDRGLAEYAEDSAVTRPSLFSAIRQSVGAVSSAVMNLFKSIAASFFWWL